MKNNVNKSEDNLIIADLSEVEMYVNSKFPKLIYLEELSLIH